MLYTVGIDSRIFERKVIKKNGDEGTFNSVLGVAVKIKDYQKYQKQYTKSMESAFSIFQEDYNYGYYCVNDMRNISKKYEIINEFVKQISKHIDKIHIFYTLFSKKRVENIKVYGRYAKKNNLKLSEPTRTIEQFIPIVDGIFPLICAWRLMSHFYKFSVDFHLDSHSGHIFDGLEQFEEKGYKRTVYTNGDCCNPVISTADLLIDLIDKRLQLENKFLLFENMRPILPEFGEKVLVYPITTKHLSDITPIDKVPIDVVSYLKHPVFWVFKGDPLINSWTLSHSDAYRNLIDYAACKNGVVKLFENKKDIAYVQDGDFGVYFNNNGKEVINTYNKCGKNFKPLAIDFMVPDIKDTESFK